MNAAGTLRQRREKLGLSQAALGEQTGVEAGTVCRSEQRGSIPQRRFWSKLTRLLDAPIAELIGVVGASRSGARA
jgi:transcriptional regulator with XRE-family HTH domain